MLNKLIVADEFTSNQIAYSESNSGLCHQSEYLSLRARCLECVQANYRKNKYQKLELMHSAV